MSGLGLILSGGGARGAYEVGALQYIFSEFGDPLNNPPKVDLISGTSVGAVNGAFVASMIHDIPSGIQRLVDVWTGLELAHVLGFGLRQAAGLYRVLLGGSGQGEQLAANKVRGARAALCNCLYTARMAREHNDVNVLAIGARVVGLGLAEEIVDLFLSTPFEGGRHARRVAQISELEEQF